MNKLEVGMYVRTRWGIAKVTSTYEENIYVDRCFQPIDETMCFKEDIIGEPSHNIIDLIEVGDYVNGYKVSFKDKDLEPFVQCDYPVQEGTTNHYRFYEKAIETIVTREQFSNMKYKIGD